MNELLWLFWYAQHADNKEIQKISNDMLRVKTKANDKEISDNWKKLKSIIGGLK